MVRCTLSVHMSNYNDGDSIGAAIEAICTQSRTPDEFIIIDDGSTDDSVEIIRQCIQRYPIIRLEQNDQNRGIVYTINRGLRLARGDFIYFSSANDRVLPGFFEKSMTLLEANPSAHLCCTGCKRVFADTGEPVPPDGREKWLDTPSYLTPQKVASKLNGHGMYGTSWITRRATMIEMGGYCPELKWHCDYFLHHMIALRYGACYIPDELVVWRSDPGNSYSAGMHNLALQRDVFIRMVRLVLANEYKDVAELVVRGKLFNLFEPVLEASALIEAMNAESKCSRSVLFVMSHLWWKWLQCTTRYLIRQLAWDVHVIFGLIANKLDQLYAHSFDRYDRLRRFFVRRIG